MFDRSDMTLGEALVRAEAILVGSGVPEPQTEALFIFAHVMGITPGEVYPKRREPLNAWRVEEFAQLVGRRLSREPLQYIIGSEEFLGLEMKVTPDVLIPRPETELLVERAVKWQKDRPAGEALHILDLCTGSGCVAVALAKELGPKVRITGVDISAAALDVARENAARHAVADRVEFISGDLYEGLDPSEAGSYDLIVSNPPYVRSGELSGLAPEISDFEPALALDGGPDGLGITRRVVEDAAAYLAPGGALILEIGFGQGPEVRRLIEQTTGVVLSEVTKDYSGIERVVKVLREDLTLGNAC